MSYSFAALCSVSASTKRRASANVAPTANLADIDIMPLMPIAEETAFRMGLKTPHELKQTFTAETDILDGDILTVASEDYPVKAVAEWPWLETTRLLVIIEDIKA